MGDEDRAFLTHAENFEPYPSVDVTLRQKLEPESSLLSSCFIQSLP